MYQKKKKKLIKFDNHINYYKLLSHFHVLVNITTTLLL